MTWRLWPTLLVTVACAVPPEEPPPPGAFEDVRRVIATLDDVVGEYPQAVAGDEASDATRMRVLTRQLHDATVFARRMPAREQEALRAIEAAIAARADPTGVAGAASVLRRRILDDRRLVLGPGAPPPRARGEELWRSQCAGCHGRSGAGDGAQGLDLVPEPKSFQDPEILATLAPSRAFSRISDGVPATAMPQWGLFSAAERWSLASLVFVFRHDPAEVARGREVVADLDLPHSPRALADRTDGELLAELRGRGLDEPRAAGALAYLRAEAAFAIPAGPLAGLRARLADAVSAYRDREWARAIGHAATARAELAAMVDGVRVSDPETAALLEHTVLSIQHGITHARLAEEIEREVARADALIDRAEARLRAPSVVRGVRLALSDALAAAIGLGLLAANAWHTRRRALAAASGGLIAGAIAGISVAPGTAIAGWFVLPPLAALVLAGVLSPSRREEIRLGAMAALVAIVFAAHGRALHGALGTAGLAPWLAGATALGGAVLGAWWMGRHLPRLHPWATTLAIVIAAAAAAGRSAWLVVTSAPDPPTLLAVWRVDAVGLFPVTSAWIAAAFAGLAALITRPRPTCETER